jgi:hypothetical protein
MLLKDAAHLFDAAHSRVLSGFKSIDGVHADPCLTG